MHVEDVHAEVSKESGCFHGEEKRKRKIRLRNVREREEMINTVTGSEAVGHYHTGARCDSVENSDITFRRMK